MSNYLNILAFSPHPDDAEIGCGGSIMLATAQGLRVAIADLSEGELSNRGNLKRRKKEKAAELLGLCDRLSLQLPDTKIGTDPTQKLPIIEIIRKTRPHIVLSPYWCDRHPDHVAASKLIQEAVFWAGTSKIGKGKPYRPERLFFHMIHFPFTPTFIIDISSVWKQKMEILKEYKSQLQSDGYGMKTAISQPQFLQFLKIRAKWFGAMIGVPYGEPFFSYGPVPLKEFPLLSLNKNNQSYLLQYSMF